MGDERLQGAPSDLIYELIEISHPQYRRDNNDLHYIQTLTLREVNLDLNIGSPWLPEDSDSSRQPRDQRVK